MIKVLRGPIGESATRVDPERVLSTTTEAVDGVGADIIVHGNVHVATFICLSPRGCQAERRAGSSECSSIAHGGTRSAATARPASVRSKLPRAFVLRPIDHTRDTKHMNDAPIALPSARTAVVTGAASPRGIGRATADRLAREGWSIAILDLDERASAATAKEIADKHGVLAVGLGADISDEQAVDTALSRIEAELPPIVGLANIAGVSSPTEFLQVTAAEWDRVFRINMRGTFLVTRRVVEGMVARGFGRVVSVSSISAQRGGGSYSKVPYSASKAALLGFSRALAREVGIHGITVNCIAPGPIDTDIMGGPLTADRKRDMGAETLVGRVGQVTEVAALINFLMGEDAGFITAATYDINGGLQIS